MILKFYQQRLTMIRIKRKNVMKQNNYWKICKKKYQKLHFEHDYLKKKKKKDLVTQYNRTRKTKLIRAKKRKIVVPQDFEETKSEKLDEENGEEEQTEEESEVDKVIPRKKKKKLRRVIDYTADFKNLSGRFDAYTKFYNIGKIKK